MERRCLSVSSGAGLDGPAIRDGVLRAYEGNGLAYHNLGHIEDCCRMLDGHRSLAEDAVATELAILFHDAVYDPKRRDNEEMSALLARDLLKGYRCVELVAELIMDTRHASHPATNDGRLICDIDLAVLGRGEEAYAEYARAIRMEYGWVADADYRIGRSKVLAGFLGRERIFLTDAFHREYELAARGNLARELHGLGDGWAGRFAGALGHSQGDISG